MNLSKGSRSFEKCKNKTVNTDNVSIYNHYPKYVATLDCPRVQDLGLEVKGDLSTETQPRAKEQLKKVAGAIVCGDCIYSGMTDVQISTSRTERDQAELTRIKTHQALEEARIELDLIDPSV